MRGLNFSGEGGGAVGGARGLTSERWLMWERCVSPSVGSGTPGPYLYTVTKKGKFNRNWVKFIL
jgi:hypothetical protein